MLVELVNNLLDPLPVEKLSKTAHEFGLNVHDGVLPVKEADDKKGGIGDEEDFLGKVQRVPQTDYLLSGNFGREHIDIAKLGEIVIRFHGDPLSPHFPSMEGLDSFGDQMFI